MRRTPQRGFTLIELMTVLAIVAILTTVLAGMSSGGGAGTPTTTADNLTGIFDLARLRAASKRKTHRVLINNNVFSIWEADATGFGTAAYSTAAQMIQATDVPSGVVVWNADNAMVNAGGGLTPAQNTTLAVSIEFKPDGSSPTGGNVYLTDNNTSSMLRVFVYKVTGTALARDGW
jgi:prepilin-type N-terminal cleavage/methylation domain-containing protein